MNTDSVAFLSCFLPLTVLLHRLIPGKKGRNILLIVASLLFYSFGGLSGLLVLLAAAVVNFLGGRQIQKGRGGKVLPGVLVAANLGLLIFYKYLDFFLCQLLSLPHAALSLAAPLGISFFTFKSISYLVDLSRQKDKAAERFWEYLLYISFFPQVMAGPLTRFQDFRSQLACPDVGLETMSRGLRRFVIGLSKKLLLAAVLGAAADRVFALEGDQLNATLAWIGAVAYLLQIYFDFSGYSDMAIGLGMAFGFSAPENFRYPYIASSVGDFWHRWHISLSGWFRDYLYIPLGGNRKGIARTALHKGIVFALCGVWHGAAWTFLVWGLWHGLFAALESLIPVKKWQSTLPGKVLGHIYTLLVVLLGFVMFRAETVSQGLAVIGAMFAGTSYTASPVVLHELLAGEFWFVLAAGAVLCLPIVPWSKKHPKLEAAAAPISWVVCGVLFVLCLVKLAAGGFAPFIYAQF